jgi:outer membrane protein
MRRLLLSLILPVTLLSAKAVRAETIKIGYVDVQRAVQEVDEGKAARDKLKGKLEASRGKIESKKVTLQKMQSDYEKQAAVLSEDAKRKKQEELQTALMEAQQSAGKMQEELQGEEQELMGVISKRMLQVISDVSEKEGLAFVLDKGVLLYAPGSADITNEVVRAYNNRFSAAKSDASGAAPVKKADAKKKADKE